MTVFPVLFYRTATWNCSWRSSFLHNHESITALLSLFIWGAAHYPNHLKFFLPILDLRVDLPLQVMSLLFRFSKFTFHKLMLEAGAAPWANMERPATCSNEQLGEKSACDATASKFAVV